MPCPPAAGGGAGPGPTAQTERAYCGLHEAAQPTPRAAGAHLPSECLVEHRMHTGAGTLRAPAPAAAAAVDDNDDDADEGGNMIDVADTSTITRSHNPGESPEPISATNPRTLTPVRERLVCRGALQLLMMMRLLLLLLLLLLVAADDDDDDRGRRCCSLPPLLLLLLLPL